MRFCNLFLIFFPEIDLITTTIIAAATETAATAVITGRTVGPGPGFDNYRIEFTNGSVTSSVESTNVKVIDAVRRALHTSRGTTTAAAELGYSWHCTCS